MTLEQGSRKTWAVHGEKSKSRLRRCTRSSPAAAAAGRAEHDPAAVVQPLSREQCCHHPPWDLRERPRRSGQPTDRPASSDRQPVEDRHLDQGAGIHHERICCADPALAEYDRARYQDHQPGERPEAEHQQRGARSARAVGAHRHNGTAACATRRSRSRKRSPAPAQRRPRRRRTAAAGRAATQSHAVVSA